MKLLVEEALTLDSKIEEELNESTGKTEKNYYIEGTFSTPDVKNRNGRIYPKTLWESNVNSYQKEIQNNTYNRLGELEHPPRSTVDPMKAVMKIEKLYMENGLVKGKAKILNNNSQETNHLKALIDEGFKIGVSSRGVGRLGMNSIVEDFKLICYDIVATPSDYNANLNGMLESEGKIFTEGVLESEDFMVCGESGCVLTKQLGESIMKKKGISKYTNDEISKINEHIVDKFKELLKIK
jgi:hypothetical protein